MLDRSVRRHFMAISALQSSWATKSKRLRRRFDLKFRESPTSIADAAGTVAAENPDSTEFVELQEWLHSTIQLVRNIDYLGDAGLKGHIDALLRDLASGAQQLEGVKQTSWESEKVMKGLYHDGIVDEDAGPVLIDTGMWTYPPYFSQKLKICRSMVQAC